MSAHWRHLGIPVQIRITDQPAFLLHRRAWQNTSLILDLLTFDFGRVSLLAKGGRSSKSVGLYQPFCQLNVSWSGRQDLKTLTAIDGVRLPVSERLYLPLLYVNELLMAFLPQHESSPQIFSLYANLLENIEIGNTESCLRVFERSTMQLSGYLPEMDIDAEHGAPIQVEQFYNFKATRGFLVCDTQQPNAISGKHILAWNESRFDDNRVLQVAKTIMRSIIDFNLQGKRLKSRDIYLQMMSRK